jgi:hypothetical protein
MEERLGEKEDHPGPIVERDLPLKNGAGQMKVGTALVFSEGLRQLQERHPDQFRALWALVNGRSEEASTEQRRALRRLWYLKRDGSLNSNIKAIMLAAVRETPDGLCLVNPLDLRTPEDAAYVERFEQQREARGSQGPERLRRWLFGEDKGEDRGRS